MTAFYPDSINIAPFSNVTHCVLLPGIHARLEAFAKLPGKELSGLLQNTLESSHGQAGVTPSNVAMLQVKVVYRKETIILVAEKTNII